MSYHLEMQKEGGKPKIEMPPLPEDPAAQQNALQQQVSQPRQARPATEPEPKEEGPQYDIHPAIADSFPKGHIDEQPEEQVEQEAKEPEVEQPVVKVETKKEQDLRRLREKAERADRYEREREDLMRKIYELEAAKSQPQKPQQKEEDEFEIADDDLIEAKYLKKYSQQLKEMKEELRSYKDQANLTSVDARLKARFPDLDNVVTRENLSVLRESYPELADSLNSNSDLYNKGAAAYTLIKKLGIATEDTYQEDKIKAQKNASKPRPLASVNPQQGDSPLSKANAFANGLTDDLKKQLLKEMNMYRKNI